MHIWVGGECQPGAHIINWTIIGVFFSLSFFFFLRGRSNWSGLFRERHWWIFLSFLLFFSLLFPYSILSLFYTLSFLFLLFSAIFNWSYNFFNFFRLVFVSSCSIDALFISKTPLSAIHMNAQCDDRTMVEIYRLEPSPWKHNNNIDSWLAWASSFFFSFLVSYVYPMWWYKGNTCAVTSCVAPPCWVSPKARRFSYPWTLLCCL